MRRLVLRACLAGLLLAAGGIGWAYSASNTVPASKAGQFSQAITLNELKPPQCAGLTLTAVVSGSGTFEGTNASELILGSTGVDSIKGNGGNDCLVGGGGNDELDGSGGTDVCIGGNGTDTFKGGCEAAGRHQ